MLDSMFLLIPLSLLFVLFIAVALWWAVFSGQFNREDFGFDASLVSTDIHKDMENPVKTCLLPDCSNPAIDQMFAQQHA